MLFAASAAGEKPGKKDPAPEPVVTEAGGRLVVSGGTIVVVADADRPVNASSLATKTETPLVQTPRSVTVVDRQTLDDMQAINVTGPKAPEGKQANWLATVPGKGYFAILRLYGPTEAAINKSWKPGDIEKVK